MTVTRIMALTGLIVATVAAALSPATAGDVQGDAYDCGELFVMRNEIYKANGYCFKTARAMSQFGNAGCQYDSLSDVPLSANQRSTIRAIRKSEARQSC
ncbi:MAG: YARHG domain-containing protein [Hyphomicrobium sp.]